MVGVTDRLLTAHEVGERLGVSKGTVLDHFERGDLPGVRLWGRKGGPVRFRESVIDSLLDQWSFGATATTVRPDNIHGPAPLERPGPGTREVPPDAS